MRGGDEDKTVSKNFKIFAGCAILPAAMILVITSNLSSAIIICGIVFIMSFVAYPNYRLHGGIAALIAAGYVGLRQVLKMQWHQAVRSVRISVLQDF